MPEDKNFVVASSQTRLYEAPLTCESLRDLVDRNPVDVFYIVESQQSANPVHRDTLRHGIELARAETVDETVGWVLSYFDDDSQGMTLQVGSASNYVESNLLGGQFWIPGECIIDWSRVESAVASYLGDPGQRPDGNWIAVDNALLSFSEYRERNSGS